MDWTARLASVFALIASFSLTDARAGDGDNSGPGIILAGPFSEAAGQWRTKVQLVFDPAIRTLTRRTYTVWDASLSRDLDFSWQPADPGRDKAGRLDGQGHLVWRMRDKPAYDRSSIVAEYSGTLRNGRMEGNGTYVDSAGFSYNGHWREGLMDGPGKLQLPAGAEYVGRFIKGKASGDGRLIDIAGEVYEGQFVDGKKHGQGKTTLPNGVSYPSYWNNGQEDERSRKVRLAQAGSANLPDTRDDVRIGISVERRLPPEVIKNDHALWYNAANTTDGFQIRPANQRLLKMWREKAELQLTLKEELQQAVIGILGPTREQFVPLNLRIELQNKSTSPIQVTGLYLDVRNSSTETKPAIQMTVGSAGDCNGRLYAGFSPALTFKNFGWSPAEGVGLQLSLLNPQGGESPFTIRKTPGDLDKTMTIDVEGDLKSMAVDTNYLKTLEEGFVCSSQAPAQCLNRFRATGKLGKLANFVQLSNITFVLKFASLLTYSWRDAKGSPQNWAQSFTTTLPLGFIKPSGCGAEQGGPQIITTKAQHFRLDASNYRIPISYQVSLAPTRTIPLVFPVEAEKSSTHDFAVAVQLSDGREIRSRPINLLYYRPRWIDEEKQRPPYDEEGGDDGLYLSYYGLNGKDLRQVQDSGDQWDKCKLACKADAKCVGYTRDDWNKLCVLKSEVVSLRHDPRLSSGLKKGIKRPVTSTSAAVVEHFPRARIQRDLPPYLAALNSSYEECEQSCKSESDCVAYNFVDATKVCFLLDEEDQLNKPQPDPATESGVKYQPQ
ncbi:MULTISPECIES: PAN domain-containing protein [unclassified Bradyrhizobium]|uniref:PAN domain-containing protein n=1 Tax=unclassified Bradyrhizobium TaxID=2631580 RepID=UPI002915F35C|nr:MULTISPECIES: PAN domain-containing protein [unclassified Bradyrhizobium]